jgi:two-component system LytT family response regulator
VPVFEITPETELDTTLPPPAFLQRIAVQDGSRLVVIRSAEIDWVQADRKFLRFHVGNQIHRLRQTISELQSVLDPRVFAQVHRSHIVNLESIAELDFSEPNKAFVVLKSGRRVPLARSYRRRLRKSLTRIQ